MAVIQRLPEDLINKIAAGEVVERPASVVKELVENALDAGATTVTVEIEAGGKQLIRVRDNGEGMAPDDAERALERHATSKLRHLSDLGAIATHGFRGEALPAIAGVSHLVLRTREERSPSGTEVEIHHGRRVHAHDVGHPRGTTVEVRDLFGSVPARQKFLRVEPTETGHVAEALTLLALARPDTGFTLTSSGRALMQAPAVDGLSARLYQLFGGVALEGLVPVEGGADWVAVRGFVPRADRPASARPNLRLFVNGRAVRDRAVAKAVSEAYRAAGAGEFRGDAFLFLEMPLHLVDVNVHPAKTEVRFADGRTPFSAVERAVRQALTGSGEASETPAVRVSGGGPGGVEAAVQSFFARADSPPAPGADRSWPRLPAPTADRVAEAAEGEAGGPLVMGQHRLTYIVATDGDDLLLVDQHSAHERVRFERLMRQVAQRAVESQRLLVPLLHELAPALRPVLDANAEALTLLGYEVEPFGGAATRVLAVPAILGTRDPGPALERLLRDLLEREAGEWMVASARDRLAATLACHSAVRAGQGLTAESMAAIVRDLPGTQEPLVCPHGRPTMARIPRDEVSRWFGRSGWKRR